VPTFFDGSRRRGIFRFLSGGRGVLFFIDMFGELDIREGGFHFHSGAMRSMIGSLAGFPSVPPFQMLSWMDAGRWT